MNRNSDSGSIRSMVYPVLVVFCAIGLHYFIKHAETINSPVRKKSEIEKRLGNDVLSHGTYITKNLDNDPYPEIILTDEEGNRKILESGINNEYRPCYWWKRSDE